MTAPDLRRLGNPGSEEFRVEFYPFYLLNRAVERYRQVIQAELRRVGIDVPTWRVLMILGEHEPEPISRIAAAAVINISTMTRLIERMENARLLSTLPSAQDGRVTELALTPLGRERLAAARHVTAPVYEQAIQGFSASDFARVLSALERLHDNLAAQPAKRRRRAGVQSAP